MKSLYECNSCSYKSSRRSNAIRHIKIVHKGNAVIHNLNEVRESISNNNNDLNDKNSVKDDADQRFSDVIEKMLIPLEKLEKLTSNIPEKERNDYLSNILLLSLLTKDPGNFIKNAIEQN